MNTYLKQYENHIEQNLQDIDLWLRTTSSPFCPTEVGNLLDITAEEVLLIMQTENISILNHSTFFQVMKNGSSPLCGYFSRQLECGFPTYYTLEQISYIYNLDYFSLEKAAKFMGVTFFSAAMLKPLFSQIQFP